MTSKQDLHEIRRSLGSGQSKFKMHPKIQESSSTLVGKLQPHQEELQLLGELAGIHMDSKVFRILVEFLNMGVDSNTIFSVLKSIRRAPSRQTRSSLSQVSSHT